MRGGGELDRPETVAAVRRAFEDYEQALVDNDVERLNDAFWSSEATVRFGVADHQVGASAIAAWRRLQGPLPPGRMLEDTRITTFGDSFGVVTTLFVYPGVDRLGRQSQTWVRLAEGWRIVSAHVSEIL